MKAIQKTSGLLKVKNLKHLRAFQTAENKKQPEVAAILESDDVTSEWNSAKPFSEIPGPKPLPIPYIGNMWRLLPFGTYGNMDLVTMCKKLYEQYGPIVRFVGLGKNDQVMLFDPSYVEKMFRHESIWPIRTGLDSLKYYRTVTRKDFYGNRQGLVTSQGKEWQEFRSATNQTMMKPNNVKAYLKPISSVIDDFVERIRVIRKSNGEMPDDFLSELNKMGLELSGVIAFDVRLGCLAKDLDSDSEAMRMIENVKNALNYMHDLDFTPSVYKFISTPTWRKFVKVMDDILKVASKHTFAKWEVLKKQGEIDDNSHKSILQSLLLKTKDPKIPIIMAMDVLFAGIDTTSNSLATVLYYLSINPDKQEKLFEELKKLLPSKTSEITDDILNELKYTRAVIKESLRIKMTVLGTQRVTVKDMVFGGYQIPKDTMLLAGSAVMCRMENHFKDSEKFLPERWLKTEVKSDISFKNTHPFVYIPFGFGQRSCIGRRFAEMEMELTVAKVIRNYQLSYHHEPMTWKMTLLNHPTKPLRFKMVDRSD